MVKTIRFTLNDKPVSLDIDEDRTLLWVLRTELGLTGAKYGCGEGACGACTVLVDGEALPSCQLTVGFAAERRVTTIEGIGAEGKLHPIQRAFVRHDALQCGFCTPGMILKAHSLLAPIPTRPATTSSRPWTTISAAAGPMCASWRPSRPRRSMLKGGKP